MANPLITHAVVSGAVANPNALVDGPAWDAQHTVTGLENVDNTSDANKPISTATQSALDAKQPLDADLTAIAAISATGVVHRTGTNTWTAGDKVTNAELSTVATATFKGRTTAGTGAPEDLTAAQATALLNAFVGDSGSGGTKGLAPAPSAGDAAAGKFLKADGTYAVPPGGREKLIANRTYYVRTDGSNSNTGLVNSSGGAFLTWQFAVDFVKGNIDCAGWFVTIQAGETSATFTGGVALTGAFVGDANSVTLVGNPSVAITGATNATPIVVTAPGHNYVNGKNVVISGVAGNTGANGSFLVASTNTGAGTFALTKCIDSSNVAGTGAYTSGGSCQVVDQIVISTAGRPLTMSGSGASISMNGFKLISSGVQLAVVQDGAFASMGKMSYGTPGSGIAPFFITRDGRFTQTDSYSISGSPGSPGQFVQASHGGKWRQQLCTGWCTANITIDSSNSGFLYVDNGEIVTTGSPGGVPFSANGFTVTGRKWNIVENGIIQVEGSSPPLDAAVLGSINGIAADQPCGVTVFGTLPAPASALTGVRYFITDCNSTTFHATAAGGGANKVNVTCDGAQWLVG